MKKEGVIKCVALAELLNRVFSDWQVVTSLKKRLFPPACLTLEQEKIGGLITLVQKELKHCHNPWRSK